jgi:hypothetical protein
VILHYKTFYFGKTCAEKINPNLFTIGPVVFAPRTQTYATELKEWTIAGLIFGPNHRQLHYKFCIVLVYSRFKELNPRRRVYVEIPKPSRVELKCSQNPETLAKGFDVILVTPESVLVSQRRPDAEGLISILKCLKAKSYVLSLPWLSYQDPLHSERGYAFSL